MPDILNFTLSRRGYFSILMNILEHSSEIQLSYLEVTWSFQIFYLLGRSRAMLGLMIPHYWGETFLSTQPDALWPIGSPVWLAGADTVPSLVWDPGTVPSYPFGPFFLRSLRYLPHLHAWTVEFSRLTLSDSFSVQLSHLQNSVLPTTVDSQLCLLNPVSPLDSSWVTSSSCHHLKPFSMQEAVAMIGLTPFSTPLPTLPPISQGEQSFFAWCPVP